MQHKNLLAGDLSVHEDLLEGALFSTGNRMLHTDAFGIKYLNLKLMHELQKGIVKHFLHNLMTPISAMSGYLELLRECLQHGAGEEKLERYREKVEEGLDEVGFLLGQLNELYRQKHQEGRAPQYNLNWIIEEVTGIARGAYDLKSGKICCTFDRNPVFIQADQLQIKLMIHNMITAADQFCTEKSRIELLLEQPDEQEVRITVRSTGETRSNPQFVEAFRRGVTSLEETVHTSVANNLIISSRLARHLGGSIRMVEEAETTDTVLKEKVPPALVCTLPLTISPRRIASSVMDLVSV